MTHSDVPLTWFLRSTALVLLSATAAVFMPTAWMSTIHDWLGLGPFPDAPLVQYLTRSVSLLYAFAGAGYWFMSYDVRRYLPLLRFTIPCTVVFDIVIVAIDVWIEMPTAWIIGEGVSVTAWTIVLWWLVRTEPNASAQDDASFANASDSD
ncbi:MAG: hypothetical protein FJ303_09595 [Planctomycetes bacterium]|nr:hypothetical protein [Planctomycetota bacterium]